MRPSVASITARDDMDEDDDDRDGSPKRKGKGKGKGKGGEKTESKRAALLSGAPGIGKTTTALVVSRFVCALSVSFFDFLHPAIHVIRGPLAFLGSHHHYPHCSLFCSHHFLITVPCSLFGWLRFDFPASWAFMLWK